MTIVSEQLTCVRPYFAECDSSAVACRKQPRRFGPTGSGNHIATRYEMDRRDGRRDWIILVADDSAEVRTLWSRLLRSVGFRVAEVANGSEAVRLATRLRPDLLIFDIEMPGLNGIAALRRIRQANRRVPAVAVTGRPELCQHTHVFDAVLQKDVDPAELLTHIRNLLRESLFRPKAWTRDTLGWWFRMRKRLVFAAVIVWIMAAFRHLSRTKRHIVISKPATIQ